MNIGIYIYEDAEVLDFSGPFEVFSTANRVIGALPLFNPFLIAENLTPVMARGGYSVNPKYSIASHPDIDVLVVVGGVHTGQLLKRDVISWVATTASRADIVASVCTGAFVLAESGVISGLSVTTHWEDMDDLQNAYPDLRLVSNRRWVDAGKFVTSGGISAGIDMSLHLVSRLSSREVAQRTARQMEFDWRES